MQLIPYFQPIIDISSAKVAGHEVLARYIDDEGGVRSAGGIFHAQHYSADQLLAFDRSVRKQALKKFAEAGQPGFLTLNISPRWIERLEQTAVPTLGYIEEYGIDPSKIVVEIIETHADSQKLLQMVRRYKDFGVKVAVDDFGAGHAQFDRVINLAPDIIKLDMRLFKNAVKGGLAEHMVQSVSYLAERLGSQILCEGIEDYEELRFGLGLGSRLIQGYMFEFAQPYFTDADRFSRMISIQRKRFFIEKIDAQDKILTRLRTAKQQVELLAAFLRGNGMLLSVDSIPVQNDQIMRVYICDNGGGQRSSTFFYEQGRWFERNLEGETNWCWRPYFYQLLAEAEVNHQRLVVSSTYHDMTTAAQVMTIACYIDADNILLVDVKQSSLSEN